MIWQNETKEAVLSALGTSAQTGLFKQQVAEAQKTHGKNILREKPPVPWYRRFLGQFANAMVIILMIAALISIGINIYSYFRGMEPDWIDPIAILLIVVLNAIMGSVQESRAEAAIAALKNLSAPSAHVLRDGQRQTISAHDLVPGDILFLEAGDLIPADGRLLETVSFRVDESMLTGESIPAEKDAGQVVSSVAQIGDRVNMAYSGCVVAYGKATAVVTDIGMNTEIGKIALLLEREKKADTPLQAKLGELGKKLGFLALFICALIFVVGILDGLPFLDMFMTSVSLAVAAIPEGLPTVVTIVLALGVQRMADKNAIVRRLPAVETLGCASVICTDKTGTLTQNKMTLVRCYVGGRIIYLDDAPGSATTNLLRLAALCTDGDVSLQNGEEVAVGDPTETAILSYTLRHNMSKSFLLGEYPRVGEIPFDSDRKLMTSVHMVDGRHVVIVKGAPDILLSRCPDVDTESVMKANHTMGKEALRVLAVGYKYIDDLPVVLTPEEMETGLTFAGLLGMIDPPRPEAVAAIAQCKSARICPVMITGDHVVTASAIGQMLGILDSEDQALSGAELAAMSDEELFRNIRHYRVYARVSPTDKLRIIKAWQQAGEIVAMTGDGVNDAPALKAADIGCAMGQTGTDVAKGAADVVLTDDNFATVVTAVRRGRCIYDNIRKSVHFLLSCNLGEILVVLLSMLFWKESPLLPIQLLWVNLVTDSLPALALGLEPGDPDVMKRRPRPKTEGIFAHGLGFAAVWQGMMIGVLTLIAYALGRQTGSLAVAETMAFATMAFSELVHAFNTRSTHSLFRIGLHTNPWMLGAFLLSSALVIVPLCWPLAQTVFRVVTLTQDAWWIVIGLSLTPLVIMELYKLIAWLCRTLFARKEETDVVD
ncbi:MAG: calcium-translocating P-type ATPase, PMCA-type [Clostridia bacterium]|nr:calcium-translocating P-type ATPase, PMCA-type [Clostridia bacterium]